MSTYEITSEVRDAFISLFCEASDETILKVYRGKHASDEDFAESLPELDYASYSREDYMVYNQHYFYGIW